VYVGLVLALRVLTWSLGSRRGPAAITTEVLRRAEWDVALLQGAPAALANRLGALLDAEQRQAMASIFPLPARRASVILARRDRIVAAHAQPLGRGLQRGGLQAARLACGAWAASVQLSEARAEVQAAQAARAVLDWAGEEPAVMGGNLGAVTLPRFTVVGAQADREDRLLVTSGLTALEAPAPGPGPLAVTLALRA
jgi:hypothetical protein